MPERLNGAPWKGDGCSSATPEFKSPSLRHDASKYGASSPVLLSTPPSTPLPFSQQILSNGSSGQNRCPQRWRVFRFDLHVAAWRLVLPRPRAQAPYSDQRRVSCCVSRSEDSVDIAISRSSFDTKRLPELSLCRLASQMNAKCASMIMLPLTDVEQHIDHLRRDRALRHP